MNDRLIQLVYVCNLFVWDGAFEPWKAQCVSTYMCSSLFNWNSALREPKPTVLEKQDTEQVPCFVSMMTGGDQPSGCWTISLFRNSEELGVTRPWTAEIFQKRASGYVWRQMRIRPQLRNGFSGQGKTMSDLVLTVQILWRLKSFFGDKGSHQSLTGGSSRTTC